MKKIFFSVVTCLTVSAWATNAFGGTSCSATSEESDHQYINGDAANDDHGYCFQTAENMNVTIYEFGMCTGHASPTDKSQCTILFESAAGKEMNLTLGSSLELADTISLTEGTYTHAYIVFSNVTEIKAVLQFSTVRSDDSGNRGVYCYTDGRSWDNNPNAIMSCGNNPSNAALSAETLGLVDANDNYASSELGYTVTMGGDTVVTNLYAIDSAGALSTSYNDDFALFGSQKLVSDVTITPNTSNLDIAFSITDGVSIGFDNAFDLGTTLSLATDGPSDAILSGIKFKITAN